MTGAAVTIIGAGQAGGWVAATMRTEGYAGPITLIGDEPHPPYERPPLSKEALLGKRALEDTYLKHASFYDDANISLRTGTTVAAIDRSARMVVLADGSRASYDKVVLATGARARRIDLPGADSPRIHYLRDIADMLRLQPLLQPGRVLAIVGGGFIGMEIAASAAQLGIRVTVLEQADKLIGRVLPRAVSDHLANRHSAEGVAIRTGVRVTGFSDRQDGIAITLEGEESILADMVVIGIGSVPNSELAEMAGLAVDDGILVDALGQTSDPDILAAGDVTRHFNPLLGRHVRLESWQNAQNQAIAVARALAGGNAPYAEVPWLWSDQYDINVQMAGIACGGEQVVLRGAPESGCFSAFLLGQAGLSAAFTVNQPRDMRVVRQMIARRAVPDPAALADLAIPLQSLLPKAA